jgi:hypothetical protein
MDIGRAMTNLVWQAPPAVAPSRRKKKSAKAASAAVAPALEAAPVPGRGSRTSRAKATGTATVLAAGGQYVPPPPNPGDSMFKFRVNSPIGNGAALPSKARLVAGSRHSDVIRRPAGEHGRRPTPGRPGFNARRVIHAPKYVWLAMQVSSCSLCLPSRVLTLFPSAGLAFWCSSVN